MSNNLYVIPIPGEARRKININPEMVEFEEDGTFSVPSETKRDVFYSVSVTNLVWNFYSVSITNLVWNCAHVLHVLKECLKGRANIAQL